MSEPLSLILRLNLAAAAAVLLVLVLRAPARRLFGPSIAYGLWAMAPLACLAMLAPPRLVTVREAAPMPMWPAPAAHLTAAVPAAAQASSLDLLPLALGLVWLAGVLYALARIVWRQAQFARAARAGKAGPAVAGVLKPRIVTPADFAGRYTERERELILAHEAAHIARQDSRVNALVALVRCLAWFNPMVHALAHWLRIDQELACDARVLARHPGARRTYAEAMLKTQLALKPLPLGCHWPATGAHPLAQRIALLARPKPGRAVHAAGFVAVTLTAAATAWSAWSARPPELVWVAPLRMAATPVAWAATPPTPPTPQQPIAHPPRPTPPAAAALPIPSDPEPPVWQPIATGAVTLATPAPAEGCGQEPADGDRPRRLAPGDFGPARRIHSAAHWSSVEPGTAVRVYATATDPDGVSLITDLTAFGSQSWYRVGCIRRSPSPEKLFTSVAQHGDRFTVTAFIQNGRDRIGPRSVDLASGEAGTIALPDGRVVNVTAFARPETAAEVEAGRETGAGRRFVSVSRFLADI